MAPKSKPPSLATAPWLAEPALQQVFAALAAAGGEARVVGGAVRNALLGVPVSDVDVATTLPPEDVMRAARRAGLGVHPTGLAHGTVTVVVQGRPLEVTTLRHDVATDGRHAVVRFAQDWAEDAARRDFTMNALYCDAAGNVYDYTAGYPDLLKRRVRFVGTASRRIKEDYLRILRFFRFHAQYGKGRMDAAGLAAAQRLRAGLRTLSAERVRQELLKLLAAPGAVATLKVMAQARILKEIIPHTDEWRVISRLPADGLLRLFALAAEPDKLKDRLRLSNAEASRLAQLAEAPRLTPALTESEQRRMLYHLGPGTWRDAAQLSFAQSRAAAGDARWQALIDLPARWQAPVFPLTGDDLKHAGFATGPALGKALRAVEDWWVASDFKPGKDDLLQRAERHRG